MMSIKTNEELSILIDKATSGDEKSLETIIASVQDLVFNLSLRMLGGISRCGRCNPGNPAQSHHPSFFF